MGNAPNVIHPLPILVLFSNNVISHIFGHFFLCFLSSTIPLPAVTHLRFLEIGRAYGCLPFLVVSYFMNLILLFPDDFHTTIFQPPSTSQPFPTPPRACF